MSKKVFLVLLLALLVIQLVRPEWNVTDVPSENDIRVHYSVPGNVQSILKKACYDCHSNNTNYPWYANVQPLGWWLQHHIDEGKEELNFSEFGAYPDRRAGHKLEELIELVKKGEMPLSSYTWLHKDAVLTQDEKETLVSWADNIRKSLEGSNE